MKIYWLGGYFFSLKTIYCCNVVCYIMNQTKDDNIPLVFARRQCVGAVSNWTRQDFAHFSIIVTQFYLNFTFVRSNFKALKARNAWYSLSLLQLLKFWLLCTEKWKRYMYHDKISCSVGSRLQKNMYHISKFHFICP